MAKKIVITREFITAMAGFNIYTLINIKAIENIILGNRVRSEERRVGKEC